MVVNPLRPLRLARRLVVVGILVALVGGAWAADRAVAAWAEQRLAGEVSTAVPEAGAVDVDIDSFPFLPRLVGGTVERLTVRLDDVTGFGVDLSSLTFTGTGIKVDVARSRLENVDLIEASAVVRDASITAATGIPVIFTPGRVRVVVDGRTLDAGVAVQESSLVVTPSGLAPVTIDLGLGDLLPCPTIAVTIGPAVATLSCQLDGLPPALARAVGGA